MNWKHFFIQLAFNSIITIALASLGLGVFFFILAGQEGLVNGLTWGLILGIMSIPFTAMVIMTKYWEGYSTRYGAWWIKKETEGENPSVDEKADKWPRS